MCKDQPPHRLHDRAGLGMGVRPTGAVRKHDAQTWWKEPRELIFTRSYGPETSMQQRRLNEEGNGAWRGVFPGQRGADLWPLFSRLGHRRTALPKKGFGSEALQYTQGNDREKG